MKMQLSHHAQTGRPVEAGLTPARSTRPVGAARAAAAVVWAIAFLVAVHGRQTPTSSGIPLQAGLLLAAYPLIDAVASLIERRGNLGIRFSTLVVDGLAVAGALVATLALDAGSVLIVFGTWAVVSGILQLVQAWTAPEARRTQLPLILSGGISAIAGASFAALAAQDDAQLAGLSGYAALGAAFFLVAAFLDRTPHAG